MLIFFYRFFYPIGKICLCIIRFALCFALLRFPLLPNWRLRGIIYLSIYAFYDLVFVGCISIPGQFFCSLVFLERGTKCDVSITHRLSLGLCNAILHRSFCSA